MEDVFHIELKKVEYTPEGREEPAIAWMIFLTPDGKEPIPRPLRLEMLHKAFIEHGLARQIFGEGHKVHLFIRSADLSLQADLFTEQVLFEAGGGAVNLVAIWSDSDENYLEQYSSEREGYVGKILQDPLADINARILCNF